MNFCEEKYLTKKLFYSILFLVSLIIGVDYALLRLLNPKN